MKQMLLDETQVAEHCRVSLSSVRRWRYRGEGPPYFRLNGLIRYRGEELENWLESKAESANKEVIDNDDAVQ